MVRDQSEKSVGWSAKLSAAIRILIFAALAAPIAVAQNAADASGVGPAVATSNGSYLFAPAINPNILPGVTTQIDAQIFYPCAQKPPKPCVLPGKQPLLIFLHGNHGTCQRPYNPAPGGPDPPGLPGNPHIDDNSEFTTNGKCSAPYTGEVRSDLGYNYLATRLATWGYVVVSIDANRGITGPGCPGPADDPCLIKARGRLVLSHLQQLSTWNKNGGTAASVGTDLKGHLDFGNVGLLGHSRGGEGVRDAYEEYRALLSPWPSRIPDSVTFTGIFEIAPTDIQGNIEARGTVWNVLLPMCDGDVSDLAGLKPFDRMMQATLNLREAANPTQKSTYGVWGANHNFYNTEWQVTDSVDCIGVNHTPLFPLSPGSQLQRLTGLSSVLAFFRANVGMSPTATLNQNFNPLFGLPLSVHKDNAPKQQVNFPARVDRGFTPSPSFLVTTIFEDFDQATGTNSYGVANDSSKITINHCPQSGAACNVTGILGAVIVNLPNHDAVQTAGKIEWANTGADVFFQANWTPAGTGKDVTAFKTIDLRVSRQTDPDDVTLPNPDNPTVFSDFSIRLVGADGTMTGPLLLSTYIDRGSRIPSQLDGPVGAEPSGSYGFPVGGDDGGLHPMLPTVRIPLGDFTDFAKVQKQLRSVRLTFDQVASDGTKTGAIYVANIRLSSLNGSGADAKVAEVSPAVVAGEEQPFAPPEDNQIQSDRAEASRLAKWGQLQHEAEIKSVRSHPATDARRGGREVEIEVFSKDYFPVRNQPVVLRIGARQFLRSRDPLGTLHTLIFTLTAEEFSQVADCEEVTVQYGLGGPSREHWNCGRLNKGMVEQAP